MKLVSLNYLSIIWMSNLTHERVKVRISAFKLFHIDDSNWVNRPDQICFNYGSENLLENIFQVDYEKLYSRLNVTDNWIEDK